MYDKTAIELAKTKEVEGKLKEDFERSQFDLEMCRERFDKCQVSLFLQKNTFHRPTLCWNKYLARVPLTIVVPRYFRLLDWALLLLHWAVRVLWSESFHPFHLYLSSCYDPPVVRLTNWLICSWWSIGWNNPLIFWKCHHPIYQKLGSIWSL